jgi:peptide deformylase
MSEYEMIMKLDDKVLREPTKRFDFNNPPMDPTVLFEYLRDTMIAHNGLGLAANQVGIPYSVFVIGNPHIPESIFSVFNPSIVDYSNAITLGEEGCLSFPNLFLKVKRSNAIKARFSGHDGKVDTIKFDGFTARAFQHEFDHLQGEVFMNKASKFHLDQAKRNKTKLDRR